MKDQKPPAAGEAARLMLYGSDICPEGRPGIRLASLYGITEERLAQGAFIVRACNSHAALVEALEFLESCKMSGYSEEKRQRVIQNYLAAINGVQS